MKKKADLTAKQLVTIIILIVSFSVILLFFFNLNLGKETDVEICRTSVVQKSKGIFGDLGIQYKCKTQDVSIPNLESNKVYEELLKLQEDCFWMFGEGKIDLGDRVCAICSVIEFEGNEVINQENYFKYLESKNVEGESFNYLYYFYGEHYWSSLKKKWEDGGAIPKKGVPEFDVSKKYMVFYSYVEKEIFDIGISPYRAENIEKLNCKEFATSA